MGVGPTPSGQMYHQGSGPATVRLPRATPQSVQENTRSVELMNFERARNQMMESNYSAQVPEAQPDAYPLMLNNPSDSQLNYNYRHFASNPNLQPLQNLAHDHSRQTLTSNAPTEGGHHDRSDPQHSFTHKSCQSPILINTDSHNLLPTFNNAGYNQVALASQAPIDALGLAVDLNLESQSHEPQADVHNSSLGAHAIDSIAGLQNQVINGFQHPVYAHNDLMLVQQSM